MIHKNGTEPSAALPHENYYGVWKSDSELTAYLSAFREGTTTRQRRLFQRRATPALYLYGLNPLQLPNEPASAENIRRITQQLQATRESWALEPQVDIDDKHMTFYTDTGHNSVLQSVPTLRDLRVHHHFTEEDADGKSVMPLLFKASQTVDTSSELYNALVEKLSTNPHDRLFAVDRETYGLQLGVWFSHFIKRR